MSDVVKMGSEIETLEQRADLRRRRPSVECSIRAGFLVTVFRLFAGFIFAVGASANVKAEDPAPSARLVDAITESELRYLVTEVLERNAELASLAARARAAERRAPQVRALPDPTTAVVIYLLTPETRSAMHRLGSDEVFHFYLGHPAIMLLLQLDGSSEIVTLGHDIAGGQKTQLVVPSGVWQGMHLKDGGEFALMGTTVSPGFDYSDFELGTRNELIRRYPDRRDMIDRLT